MRAQTQLFSLPNLDAFISSSLIGNSTSDAASDISPGVTVMQFVPTIHSGGFADIGPRQFMEDEHIMIDDLAMHMGSSLFTSPKPSAFYGVFDGHGGPEAAAFVRKNLMRIFFKDAGFPESCDELDELFLRRLEKCISKAFQLADLALADECTISSYSGTTALTALVLGRLLLVANVGDCRAVLCRKGEAIEMSEDHRPTTPSEKTRVEEMGGYVEDGYLNGILSVSRALGDWDMKLPKGTASTLIAEPEVRQIILTEEDEFLIIGCDGIWDVMSSQQAVRVVRRGLRRHGDPQQSAKELVREALNLNTFDNLTVVVVCFSSSPDLQQGQRFKCSLSSEALTTLQNMLDANHDH